MINKVSRNDNRKKRHLRIRQTVIGTPDRLRLNVFVRINRFMHRLSMIQPERHYAVLLLWIRKSV